MKKMLSALFLTALSFQVYAGLKKEFKVTKLIFDEQKKTYLVHFENQAGVYKADEKFFKCLSESLESKKAFKIEFRPMGLTIMACERGESR